MKKSSRLLMQTGRCKKEVGTKNSPFFPDFFELGL